MSFENVNYSTSDKINETIQDKIDNQKINIKNITKKNITKLKVDILDSKSSLKVRDENWNILWRLNDNEEITFNWETLIKNKKLFLWFNFNWKIWYISADYVKWDIITPIIKKDVSKTDKQIKGVEQLEWNKKVKVVQKEPTKETLIEKKYLDNFNIPKLKELNLLIEKNWLNLDLSKLLTKYKDVINNDLKDTSPEIKNKIIESIEKRVAYIWKIIEERIAWVDEEIQEWDLLAKNREKEIQNQRWIINEYISDLFSEINNKVIPAALVLTKVNFKKMNLLEEKIEAEKMFKADILEDWKFDKTWVSWEVIDANTNNWNVFDISEKESKDLLAQSGINIEIETPSLLNEADKTIEDEASIAYVIYVISMLIPYVWMATAIPADVVDLCSDNEWVTTMLRETWIVDKDFRMEKNYWDTLLWGASILLSVFWLQSISKWWKLIKANSLLAKIKVDKLESLLNSTWKKMWITEDRLNQIKEFLKIWKKNDKQIVQSVDDIPDLRKLDFTKKEIDIIDSNFSNLFNKLTDWKANSSIEIAWKKITVRWKWEYLVEWSQEIIKKDDVLKMFTAEEKYENLLKISQKNISKLTNSLKFDKKWFFDFKWKYKVSKDEIIKIENGKKVKLTPDETEIFYKEHWFELIEKMKGVNFEKEIIPAMKKQLTKIDQLLEKWQYKWDSKTIKKAQQFVNFLLKQLTDPLRMRKELKSASGFSERTKAILFWNKDITKIWGLKKASVPILFSWLESALGDEAETSTSFLINYFAYMWLPVLWFAWWEYMQLDEGTEDFFNNYILPDALIIWK